jgi:L-2-hydroxyglutarate oxidase
MGGQQHSWDIVVIGAGIVGASTAWQLARRMPGSRILLLEKEDEPARHQTGRNSGVIHAGVYYEPGSLKARFCREGLKATYEFCREQGIPCDRRGKLLVATNALEQTRMDALFDRCRQNGLAPRRIDAGELRKLEPAVRGLEAILVEESGITDYAAICRAMVAGFRRRGGEVRYRAPVLRLEENPDGVRIGLATGTVWTRRLVVCGGLMADRLARMQGLDIDFRTVPYRGKYFRLADRLEGLVRHLVYPIPNPDLPFLGVHLTPTVDGGILVGPNAAQGWKREGYGRVNISIADSARTLAWPGYWRFMLKHLRAGLRESWLSLSKAAYLAQVRRYCPGIEIGDLEPHPVGIRAQAVLRDGALLHDFLIERTARTLHVCNAPSPAATSAIPIGRYICELLLPSGN